MWQFLTERWVEALGFLTGLLYLWLEYKADRRLWLVGVVMPCISMYVYFTAGLYADFAINIYYLLIAAYGWWAWRRKTTSNNGAAELKVSHFPIRYLGLYSIAFAAIWALLWWLLTFTNSTVAVADSFTTAMSIVGMVMLARKYAEQWLIWFVVDIVCTVLYIYKGIYFYAVLYAIYTIISLVGYRKWIKMIE